MNTEEIINLEDYREEGRKIFLGREHGEEIKKKSKFNEKIRLADKVILIIPDDIVSINPSFFEGLIHDAVILFGSDAFYAKLSLKNNTNDYNNFYNNLRMAVNNILLDQSILNSIGNENKKENKMNKNYVITIVLIYNLIIIAGSCYMFSIYDSLWCFLLLLFIKTFEFNTQNEDN